MFNMSFTFIFGIWFIGFQCAISTTHRLIELTDRNFDVKIKRNVNNKKWFIIFYVHSCSYCEQMLNVVEKEIIPNYNNDNTIEFAAVNCHDNIWLPLRFNITYIPYTVLIDVFKQQMFEFKLYSTFEHISGFIDSEKDDKDAIAIPSKYNYYTRIKVLLTQCYYAIKINSEHFLKEHGININISDYILVPCCIVLIICVFKLQSLLLNKVKLLFNKTINKNKKE